MEFHYEADGLTMPTRIAGHPAVEFCNTRAAWGERSPKEYLRSYDHVAVWARENGLISSAAADQARAAGAGQPDRAADLLTRAVRLREALYAIAVHGRGDAWWPVLSGELGATASAVRLAPGRGEPYGTWVVGGDDALLTPFAAVVWAVGRLLAEAAKGSVRACPGRGCGWAFYDPRGRRRWCQMAWCGNRTKVRRHSERRRDRVEPGAAASDG
jgi:predicted RNA-binding Zn ribbon-like protein